MCQVDGLIVEGDRLRAILEVEESSFLPTTICGKLLQAELSTHFANPSHAQPSLPIHSGVLFVQVLDASKCIVDGGGKESQALLIEQRVRELLPFRHGIIGDYRLFLIDGSDDQAGLEDLGAFVAKALA